MRNLLSTLIIYLSATISLAAQVPQEPTYGMTPNAKSFQRYGDIPVSLYTGTPDISIPLATLREGELTLPISLSYHSGGIKADEHPGWTGLGWTLMAGGAITREKYDLPDELDQFGFIHSHGAINGLDLRPWMLDSLRATYGQSIYFSLDLQPDKFNFHLPGCSGFFMMNTKGEWVVSCDRPMKLESHAFCFPYNMYPTLFPASNNKIFSSFTLIDEHGVKYTFGEDAIDMGINIRAQASPAWEASAWHLKRIEHPNGDRIEYTYTRGDFIVNFTNTSHCSYYANSSGQILAASYPDEEQGILISPVYLYKIEGETFKAVFHHSKSNELNYTELDYQKRLAIDLNDPNCRPIYFSECGGDPKKQMAKIKWLKLNAIHFYDKTMTGDGIFRRVLFSYIDNSSSRLILNGINFVGSSSDTQERYRFSYDYPELMPPYLSKRTDHWGYYNDSYTNDIDSAAFYNTPNSRTMLFGSLREITYPTGGRTILDFEPHSYSKIANKNGAGTLSMADSTIMAGGIRIKRIINIPNDSTQPEIREFFYTKNFHPDNKEYPSSGILECPPEYSVIVPYPGGGSLKEYSDRPISNIINGYGQHVCYPEVAERRQGNGFTIRRFTSCEEPGFKDEPPLIQSHNDKFVPISGKAAYRGRLQTESIFDEQGNILKERWLANDVLGGYSSYVHSLYYTMCGPNVSGSGATIRYERFSIFKTFTYKVVNTSVQETVYGADKSSHTTTRYFRYNNDGLLRSDSLVTMHMGKKQTEVSSYTYAYETDLKFKQQHILNKIKETTRRHNGKLIESISNAYEWKSTAPYLSAVTRLMGTPQQLYLCSKADDKGRPLLVQNADAGWTAYVWGNHSVCPIAEIKLPTRNDYNLISSISPGKPYYEDMLPAFLTQLKSTLPGALVTGYTCTPNIGVTSITDPTDKTTYYNYDPYGRLCNIMDTNGAVITQHQYSTATADKSIYQLSENEP